VKKPIILVDLSRQRFVEQVDYVTSFGHRRDGISREKYRLSGPGPQLVISDLAVFDFRGKDSGMRLKSLHPGVTLEQVLDSMGFKPELPEHVPQTEPPTAAQLRQIREQIDPDRNLLRA
jgi:glutaconate CoA-transferase subunit B